MTTITAKRLHQTIREWGHHASTFKAHSSGQPASLDYSFQPASGFFSQSFFLSYGQEKMLSSNWVDLTMQRILALPWHSDGWISGARRTDPAAAKRLLNVLMRILDSQAPAPAIVPTWLGGVQAEWHRNGVDLEISVNPGGTVEYYFNNNDEEREGIASDDWAQLKEYARAIV